MNVRRLHTHPDCFRCGKRAHSAAPVTRKAGNQFRPRRVNIKAISASAVGLLLSTAAASLAMAANPPWVHVDAAKKQVTFDLNEGGNGQAGQYNLDGYAHGHMTVTVPTGWHVTMKVTNKGSTGHSLEIIKAPKSPPPQKVKPAFKHAETKDLTRGMPPGSSSTFSFTANKAGKYWMMCAVPGHALLGMWDHFVVSSTAKRPSVSEHS